MKKCYFKSNCENLTPYICCNDCNTKNCWQRCYDKGEGCEYLNTEPEFIEMIYYHVVNKQAGLRIYIRNKKQIPLKDADVLEGDVLAEFKESDGKALVSQLNGDGRRVWSLSEARKEIKEIEN